MVLNGTFAGLDEVKIPNQQEWLGIWPLHPPAPGSASVPGSKNREARNLARAYMAPPALLSHAGVVTSPAWLKSDHLVSEGNQMERSDLGHFRPLLFLH
jgi:hypothetical protein